MNHLKYFVVDAETDGLDGSFLSIAAAVYDDEWKCVDEFYAALDNARSDNEWVQKNILPHLNRAKKLVSSEEALLKAFFDFWNRYRNESQIYADIPCPVEARLFSRSLEVAGCPSSEYPHPVIDLASILLKAGFDPNINREVLLHDSYTAHDALEDVRATAKILKMFFPSTKKRENPYSYHTFIFPFLFDNNSSVTREEFAKHLNKEQWILENGVSEHSNNFMNAYNQFHYFNTATQNALYTHENQENVVLNYKFKFNANAEYVIRKANDKQAFEYRLVVNDVRLRLFNTNVGMLQFELENYNHGEPDDICRINEYGRRIYAPFLKGAEPSYYCDGVANEIQLAVHGQDPITSLPIFAFHKDVPERTQLIAPILELLSAGTHRVTTNRCLGENEFYIEPIVDDRMFIACFYDSDKLVQKMGQWQEDDYRFMKDALRFCPDHPANMGALLYRMVFVDCDFPTCQSRTLLHKLLEKHIYTRWLEWGTVSGISEYSMISISDDPPDYIVNAFLTEYVEMLTLVLAQRASLLVFERRLSDASLGRSKISEIQRDYTRFQSQLLLQEITPQQQGIELYDMLRETLFINKEQKDIEQQIKNLFDQSENETANRQNNILFAVALVALFEGTSILSEWFAASPYCAPLVSWLSSVGLWCDAMPTVLRLTLSLSLTLSCWLLFFRPGIQEWFGKKAAKWRKHIFHRKNK